IYAGGDDVFIVGRWDLIIDFAELLQTQLLAWSCQTSIAQQPKISLSGGIATVTHKFPIMKAAAMAGKAEKKAKNYAIDYCGKKIPKNAITLWNTPLNWHLEYPIVQQLKTKIACCIDDDKNDYKGVFRNLQKYYYQSSSIPNYQIRWRIAYYIARTQARYHQKKDFCELLETLKQGIFCNSYHQPLQGNHHFFTLLNLAIRWAELNHRTNHKKQ
ncbi:MAG: hypothetical protein KA168_07895, partial [Chitinophagales bacterium]|nr:hypothetical protein [Chitinophagales bacterium]